MQDRYAGLKNSGLTSFPCAQKPVFWLGGAAAISPLVELCAEAVTGMWCGGLLVCFLAGFGGGGGAFGVVGRLGWGRKMCGAGLERGGAVEGGGGRVGGCGEIGGDRVEWGGEGGVGWGGVEWIVRMVLKARKVWGEEKNLGAAVGFCGYMDLERGRLK